MTKEDKRLRIAVFENDEIQGLGLVSLLEKVPNLRAFTARLDDLDTSDPVAPRSAEIALIDPQQTALSPGRIASALNRLFGDIGMIGFFGSGDAVPARDWLAAGFRGLLPKAAGLDSLHAAITAVGGGGIYLGPSYADVFDSVAPPAPSSRTPELTERELHVLKSVAHGKSLKEIGQELDLSAKTIETYKARGSGKLKLQGRRAIVEYAIRSGWVQ